MCTSPENILIPMRYDLEQSASQIYTGVGGPKNAARMYAGPEREEFE